MRKILHIITRLDMGGSAINTLENCLGTADRYKVVLVKGLGVESQMTEEQQGIVDERLKRARDLGIKIITVPTMIRSIKPLTDLQAVFSLWRIIRRERPDIVHTHTSKAGIVGRLAAILARVPIIIHTTHGHVFYGHFSPLVSKIFLIIERFFAAFTDRMVALTVGEKADYLKFSLCPLEKIVRIHSGVKIDKFLNAQITDKDAAKKKLGLTPGRMVVGTMGWLWPIKGPMYLLKAMQIVWRERPQADIELAYVGRGELETDLRREAEAMGVADRVKFLGWHKDTHNILPLFDIFALASLNEGMGRVLVEAMAAGKPLVASEVGGVPDLVTPGMTGILVPPGDSEALARGIIKILDYPEKAQKMGDTGRWACRNFSLQAMLDKLVTMYEDCLRTDQRYDHGRKR